MLRAVRGIYQGGVVRPIEAVGLPGRHEVVITFLDRERENGKKAFIASAGSWKDLDAVAIKRWLYEQRSVSQRPRPRI